MKSYPVKENHISSVVSEILRYRQKVILLLFIKGRMVQFSCKFMFYFFQRTGLLKMLDVECSVRGCPETYVQKVKVQHKDNTRYGYKQSLLFRTFLFTSLRYCTYTVHFCTLMYITLNPLSTQFFSDYLILTTLILPESYLLI